MGWSFDAYVGLPERSFFRLQGFEWVLVQVLPGVWEQNGNEVFGKTW